MAIKNIEDLKKVVINKVNELEDINDDYLSEAGKAAREAYRAINWTLSFHDSFASLRECEEFTDLVSTPDKHPEYYKIIKSVNRIVDRF